MQLQLAEATYRERMDRVRAVLAHRRLDALYLVNSYSIFYLSGCRLIPTERPLALVIPADGNPLFLVPRLEADHVEALAPFVGVETYFDYPGEIHPMRQFARVLTAKGFGKARIGYDAFATGAMGYEGPALSELMPDARFEAAGDICPELRLIKDAHEIAYFRESARWGARAQEALQEAMVVGELETVAALEASKRVTEEMMETLGEEYSWVLGFGPTPAFALLLSGKKTAYPHPMPFTRRLAPGDVCISSCGGQLGGYNAELERTMIIGEPSEEQVRLFEAMLDIQAYALSRFAPGRRCRDAERDVRDYVDELGYSAYLRHHTGHAIGLEIHEKPFVDLGDDTLMEPGMIFSCEPGLYVPGVGGFRHSDTLLITESGAEVLTQHSPRDLESLVIR